MVFNSFEFFAFLALLMLIYGFINAKWRWQLLLLFSMAFFASFGIKGLAFLLFTTASTFFCTLGMSKSERNGRKKYKKALLAIGLLSNFGILAVLKYFNFFASSAASLAGKSFEPLQMIIPLGISFYTFQMMGYMIDVYNGIIEPQQNFFKLLLFASYFPQMIDGPISRYADIAPMLYQPKDIEYERCRDALILFAWGLFKKICVADNIKVYVDLIFNNYQEYKGILILSGGIAYAIYLYADFSGCIDMVRGMSSYFGIELKNNFERPYFATSVEDFWRKWHITLSSWFRDYLFYPLQRASWLRKIGQRLKEKGHKKAARAIPTVIATLIVWITTGLWHGANMTFIIWGLYYGAFMTIGVSKNVFLKKKHAVNKFLRILSTFFVVCIGYIIFNSANLSDAWRMIVNMLDFTQLIQVSKILQVGVSFYKQVGAIVYFAITILSTCILFLHDILEECGIDILTWIKRRNIVIKYILSVLTVMLLLFMMNRSSGDFTYMQF